MKTMMAMQVDGIHCPNCVKKIKQTASAVPGIYYIDVEEDLKTVKIEYDPDLIDPDAVKQMIETIPGKEFIVLQTT